jgi:RHS repeat-associated protein
MCSQGQYNCLSQAKPDAGRKNGGKKMYALSRSAYTSIRRLLNATTLRFTHLATILLLFVFVAMTHAQILNVGDDTSTPIEGSGHDYIKLLSETVDPASGSVSVRIRTPPAKGRGITLPFGFAYDSNGVEHVNPGVGGVGWLSNTGELANGGWSFSIPSVSSSTWTTTSQNAQLQTITCTFASYYTFQDPAGGRHNLNHLGSASYQQINGGNSPNLCGTPVLSGGDQKYSATLLTSYTAGATNPPVQVADQDGTVYNFPDSGNNSATMPSSIEDRNGNIVTSGTGLKYYFNYYDTVGRPEIAISGFGPAGTTNTVTISGEQYKVTWISNSASYTVPTVGPFNFFQGQECLGWPNARVNQPVVKTITLPNNSSYQFFYGTNPHSSTYNNPYGLLSEIDYPDGGWVRYTWTMNAASEAAIYTSAGLCVGGTCNSPMPDGCQFEYGKPVVASRTVGFAPGVTALTQTFTYATNGWSSANDNLQWTSKTTTVKTTDPALGTRTTVYSYLPAISQNLSPYQGPGYVGTQVPLENTIKYYDWGNTTSPMRTVSKSWANLFDIASEQTTLNDANNITSERTYTYQTTSGLTVLHQVNDYDFGLSLVKQTVTNYQPFLATPIGGVIVDKPCQVIISDGSNTQYAETDYYYDGGTSLCGAAGTQATSPVSGLVAGTHDETHYSSSSTSPRGNVTKKDAQISSSTSAATTLSYDETGQVTAVTDPCGNPSGTCSEMTGSNHTTTYLYANIAPDGSSNFTILSNGANVSYTPSGTVNAYLTEITDALGHTANFKYDFNTGQLTQSTDGNGQVVTYLYYDSLARPTLVTYPDGGQTEYTYNDAAPSPSVTTCQNIDGTAGAVCSASTPPSGWNASTAIMDGVGHVVQTQLLSDLLGTDFTDTSYDGEGRVLSRSNPHRSTSLSSDGTTKYVYDALGRPTQSTNADGSIATTTYDQTNPSSTGVCTTITDEAGNSRQSCADGLGRITGVWEDPGSAPHLNYQTKYTYDPLNNLLSVSQNGSDSSNARHRSFTYDKLSRLLCSANPEVQPVTCPTSGSSFPVGAVTYSYDANGNIMQKKSPLPNQTSTSQVTANYAYDVLNRLTQKSFTGMSGQPVIRFGYDGIAPSGCTPTSISSATNLIGRRSSMCDGVGSAAWSYDPMGRTFREQHTIHGITKQITYLRLQDGEVYSLDYPDGKSVSFSPYGNGLTDGVEDDIFSFQGSHDFAPNGSLYAVDYGPATNASAASQTFYYNKRFQSAEMYLFDTADLVASYCYDFHVAGGQTIGDVNQFCTFSATSPGDNGNLYQSMNNLDATGNRTANYSYDSLNRLQQAYTTGPKWGESYVIDAWGNLTNRNQVSGKTNYEPLAAPALATNHLTGFTYDAAGNLIVDGTNTYTYDAENRLITAGGVTYSYDGDGNRVMKSNGTIYWRGSDGETLAKSNLSGTISEEYVYINGKREVRMDRPSGAVHLYFTDLVGSTTLITDVNGTPQEQSDYYPFGGEIPISGSDPNHYKFTGKERDSESGLDNFGARYDASSLGRFMTPDPLGGHYEDPQTLNRYAYVRNNPLRFTDPTGLDFYLTCSRKDTATCQGGHVGTTDDKGKFTATIVTSASLQDSKSGNTATVNGNGVQITTAQGTFGGEFINNTPAANGIQGSGALAGFSFDVNGNCGGSCLASGAFHFNGSGDQARALLSTRGAWSYWAMDTLDSTDFGFHPETDQFRFGSGPSSHLSVPWNDVMRPDYSRSMTGINAVEGDSGFALRAVHNPKSTVPINGDFHVDKSGSFVTHGRDVVCSVLGC